MLAPRGRSRLDLAAALAQAHGGTLRRFFHPQSEPSLVPGTPVFHNLTLGFAVYGADGQWIASCVDDLTLQDDLIREAPAVAGWYRILSDDERLLRLVQHQTDPESPLLNVLEPLARLFGTQQQPGPEGMLRVEDGAGASIAIAAPLPGERERPCELITAPFDDRPLERLERLLSVARALGFTAPKEGAIHLHFDATALQTAGALANLVELLTTFGPWLKELMNCNPHCRRLGSWPAELLGCVLAPDFRSLSWTDARTRLQGLPLTKYCDFNLVNCIRDAPLQNTVEVRILPVWLETQPILAAAALLAALFRRALDPRPLTLVAGGPRALLDTLELSSGQRAHWLTKVKRPGGGKALPE